MNISNLQMSESVLLPVSNHDLVTGELLGFKNREEQQIPSTTATLIGPKILSSIDEIDEIIKTVKNPLNIPEVYLEEKEESMK